MAPNNQTMSASAKREHIFTRTFNAPRELVFKAWTDPKHMAKWWGPKDFTNPVCKLDLRPGGAILIEMTGPDGVMYPMTGVFHEIDRPKKLVFTAKCYIDEKRKSQLETHNIITFEDQNGKTKLTIKAVIVTPLTSEVQEALAGMDEGWNQSLDRLAELLPKI